MIDEAQPDLFGPLPINVSSVPADVLDSFEKLAFAVIKAGFKRYSADAVLHRIRWFMQIERGSREFKCNNNWGPILARWFMQKHPEHVGFFELRISQYEVGT